MVWCLVLYTCCNGTENTKTQRLRGEVSPCNQLFSPNVVNLANIGKLVICGKMLDKSYLGFGDRQQYSDNNVIANSRICLKKSLVQSFQCASHLAHCSPWRVELSGVFPAPLAYFLPGESSVFPSAESFLALSFCFPLLKVLVAASSFVAVQTTSNHLQLDLTKNKVLVGGVSVSVEGKAAGPKGEIQVYQFMVRKVAFIFFQHYFHFICNKSSINSLDTYIFCSSGYAHSHIQF